MKHTPVTKQWADGWGAGKTFYIEQTADGKFRRFSTPNGYVRRTRIGKPAARIRAKH